MDGGAIYLSLSNGLWEEMKFQDPPLEQLKKDRWIIIALIGLSAITFYFRAVQLFSNSPDTAISMLAPDDPHYNLRLIELFVKTGDYQWFDPLTFYPYGLWLNWGPMFTTICGAVCLIFGATSPGEIAYTSMFIPPILAAACVPVAYLLGKEIGTWKTGIFAAIFIAFMSGQFFHRSVAGYLDHHTAEVFFSLLFIAGYVWAIRHREQSIIRTKNYLVPGLPVFVTWITFFLFIYTMPTAVLFAFGVFVFTIIWMLLKHDKNLAYLNFMSFFAATLTYMAFIPWTTAINLDTYSVVHILAYLSIALVGFIFVWKDGKYWYYFILAGIVGLLLLSPVRNFIISSMFQFFGQTSYTATVQEARGWTLNDALGTFNIAIPLTIAAIGAFIYSIWKERRSEHLFVLVWVLLITFSTIQHVRYEYYFAPVGAICSGFILGIVIDYLPKVKQQPVKKRKKEKPAKQDTVVRTSTVRTSMFLATVLITGVFVASSAPANYYFGANIKMGSNPEWTEPLVWMNNNTPETGMNFDTVYKIKPVTYPKPAYTGYTPGSYAVMSWWDYGHIIEYYARRPVNANPFQAGVWGEYGAANFFTNNSEDVAINIANTIGTRYVVTDIEMATGKFWAMATWAQKNPSDYQTVLLFNGQSQTVFQKPYYDSIVTRLHMFDGSYRNTDHVIFIQHRGTPPVVTIVQRVNDSAQAYQMVEQSPLPAIVAGDGPLSPTGEVTALKHFRLVHESPSDLGGGMRYVKVFEIVPGTIVKGEGRIATQVTTNTGRKFWYMQESENGEWTLPYSGTYVKENGETIEVK